MYRASWVQLVRVAVVSVVKVIVDRTVTPRPSLGVIGLDLSQPLPSGLQSGVRQLPVELGTP